MCEKQKITIASDEDIRNAEDELILIANKYHLSLKELDEIYEDVREMIININPITLYPIQNVDFVF